MKRVLTFLRWVTGYFTVRSHWNKFWHRAWEIAGDIEYSAYFNERAEALVDISTRIRRTREQLTWEENTLHNLYHGYDDPLMPQVVPTEWQRRIRTWRAERVCRTLAQKLRNLRRVQMTERRVLADRRAVPQVK